MILNQIDFELPEDYIDFMRNKNGGIVRFKNGVCLDLWKSEKLKDLNDGYHTNEFAPGNYIIGSNGGGTAFAINKYDKTFIEFEFIGMLISDKANFLANSFREFINSFMTLPY